MAAERPRAFLAAPPNSPLVSLLGSLRRVVVAGSMRELVALMKNAPVSTVIVDEKFGPPKVVHEIRLAGFSGTLIYVTQDRTRGLQVAVYEAGASASLSREDVRRIIELGMPLLDASTPALGRDGRGHDRVTPTTPAGVEGVGLPGGLVFDRRAGQVHGPGGMAQLRPEERKLLTHLVDQQSGSPSSAAQLAECLKGRIDDRGPTLIRRHMSNMLANLRKAAGDPTYDPFEALPKGYGYQLRAGK